MLPNTIGIITPVAQSFYSSTGNLPTQGYIVFAEGSVIPPLPMQASLILSDSQSNPISCPITIQLSLTGTSYVS